VKSFSVGEMEDADVFEPLERCAFRRSFEGRFVDFESETRFFWNSETTRDRDALLDDVLVELIVQCHQMCGCRREYGRLMQTECAHQA